MIYYLCHWGHENLRNIKIHTFDTATDAVTKKRYVYKKIDEADKNHSSTDTYIANQGRMYEIEGTN